MQTVLLTTEEMVRQIRAKEHELNQLLRQLWEKEFDGLVITIKDFHSQRHQGTVSNLPVLILDIKIEKTIQL